MHSNNPQDEEVHEIGWGSTGVETKRFHLTIQLGCEVVKWLLIIYLKTLQSAEHEAEQQEKQVVLTPWGSEGKIKNKVLIKRGYPVYRHQLLEVHPKPLFNIQFNRASYFFTLIEFELWL